MIAVGLLLTVANLVPTQDALATSDTLQYKKEPLYFSLITSINPRVGFSAAGGIPGIDIALDMINNRSDVLPNYTLHYTQYLDSKCEQTASLDAFFQHFTKDNETYISTVCCGCSVATIPVAEISHYWNIPLVSHSTSLTLNNHERFRSFFRVLPTFRNFATGIMQSLQQFGWRKMFVITQNEDLFTGLVDELPRLFQVSGWIIDVSFIIDTNTDPFPIESIFEKIEQEHYRIIFINTYSQFAYRIFCEAHQRGMFAPIYIWMTYPWYNRQWWESYDGMVEYCTSLDVMKALNGSIGVIPDGFIPSGSSEPSFSGITGDEYLSLYNERFKEFRINNATVTPIVLPNVQFDLTWTLALGLNNAVKRVAQFNDSGCEDIPGDIVPLEDFNYSNEKMGCILRESMGSVQFEGLAGKLKFNENGSQPDDLLTLKQYQNQGKDDFERVSVAAIDTRTNQFFFSGNSSVLWEELPYDGYPVRSIDQYHITLFTVYIILITGGIVFSTVCLLFNIVFRNKRVLKLSSPNLNYLIILGAVILYVTVFLFMYMPSAVDRFTAASAVCNLRIWLYSLGYTICFAVILSKTWRVYHIFNNPSPKKLVIKDWMLLIMIGVIVLCDIIILVVGTSINASRLEATQIESSSNFIRIEDNRVIENYIYVCLRDRPGAIIWLSISFAYKGLLQIIGIFMAFHMRKVKFRVLNDSKATTAIIYVNTIILIIVSVAMFSLEEYHNAQAALIGLALIVDASLFLGVLFIPKMVLLYKNPEGNTTLEGTNGDQNRAVMLKSLDIVEDQRDKTIEKLQQDIKKLQNVIKKANITIEDF